MAAATHREQELAANVADITAQIGLDVRTSYATASTALRQAIFLRDELLPEAREVYRVASVSYGLGGTSALDLLDAKRTLLDAEKPVRRRAGRRQRRPGRPRARGGSFPPGRAVRSPSMRDLVRPSTAAVAALALSLLTVSCGRRAEKAADPSAPPAQESAAAKPRDLTLDPAQRQKIRLEKVAPSPFHRTVETTGTVAFDQNRSTQVLAPISGPVSRILVEIGARVGRGQSLATVASPDFAADVSALRKAEATAKNARRVADLDQQLWKNDAIARRDLEQAETDAVAAEADRDAALSAAPRPRGRRQDDRRHPGEPPDHGDGRRRHPLADRRHRGREADHPRAAPPGRHHPLLHGGRPLDGVGDGERLRVRPAVRRAGGHGPRADRRPRAAPIQGKVDYIAALVDPNTRAIAVRIVAPNPNEMLKRDLYVRAEIESRRESTGLLVPVSAVLRDDENLPFVFVANPDGSFARRRVQIGTRVGDRQEITSGLTAGETIVVEGGLFLQTAESQ